MTQITLPAEGTHEFRFVIDGFKFVTVPHYPKRSDSYFNFINYIEFPNYLVQFKWCGKFAQIAGSFNLWQPENMDFENGTWVHSLFLPAGKYPFKFVVDGQWLNAPLGQYDIDSSAERNNFLVVSPTDPNNNPLSTPLSCVPLPPVPVIDVTIKSVPEYLRVDTFKEFLIFIQNQLPEVHIVNSGGIPILVSLAITERVELFFPKDMDTSKIIPVVIQKGTYVNRIEDPWGNLVKLQNSKEGEFSFIDGKENFLQAIQQMSCSLIK